MVLSCGRLCFAAAHPRASGPTHMHPTEFTAAIWSLSIPGCAGLCSQLKQQWRVGSGFATARCQHASAPMHSLCVHVQPCGAGLSLLPSPCTSGACIASPVQHGRGRWDAGGMQAQHSQRTRPAHPADTCTACRSQTTSAASATSSARTATRPARPSSQTWSGASASSSVRTPAPPPTAAAPLLASAITSKLFNTCTATHPGAALPCQHHDQRSLCSSAGSRWCLLQLMAQPSRSSDGRFPSHPRTPTSVQQLLGLHHHSSACARVGLVP